MARSPWRYSLNRAAGTARTTVGAADACALTYGARAAFRSAAGGMLKILWDPNASLLGGGNDGEWFSAPEAPPASAAELLLPEPPPRCERARTSAASTAAAAA